MKVDFGVFFKHREKFLFRLGGIESNTIFFAVRLGGIVF